MILFRRLREIDVVVEAAWYFLFVKILQDAEAASLIVIHRIERAFMVCTRAKNFRVCHVVHHPLIILRFHMSSNILHLYFSHYTTLDG